ncbi:MAG TPA: prolyl oligopeptidase family serine peptidase [Polyangiaceae bacterium]|nr:prolyl oligopeptidase family serine peptidase [Polyangiaceae bacterium]
MTDVHFGRRVVDPYRWLEETSAPEVVGWLRAQNDYARRALDRTPGRAAMLARLHELDAETTRVEQALVAGGGLFFSERPPGRQKFRVRHRPPGGAERSAVDIEASAFSAVDYFTPSPDGRSLAYGASEGGGEDSTLFVVDAASGRPLGPPVPHARAAFVTWAPEGDAFFYSQETEQPGYESGGPAERKLIEMRVYARRLDAGGADPPVFGYGLPGSPFVAKYDLPRLALHAESPFALGLADLGLLDPVVVSVKRRDDLGDPAKPWRVIAPKSAGLIEVVLRGREVFALTAEGAPRYKLVRYALGAGGEVADVATILPEGRAVLKEVRLGADALYVSALDGASSRLYALGPGGGPPSEIALPAEGAVSALAADPSTPGCVLRLETWTREPRWLRCSAATGRCEDLGLVPPSPVRFDDVEARHLSAKSADGTAVPLTVLARRGTAFDGRNPTWLWGYGAYGIPLTPNFRPMRRAWFDAGGVIAVAHVRGGGEFGRPWHRAALRERKVRAVEDYLACAEELVRARVTSPARLAAYGRSAGGILAGGAITRRPELFGAAFIDVGALNMLRIERWPGGPPNAEEFGSVDTPEGFRGLYEVDAYHHVAPGVRYPAVLLATGANDPRQPAWSPAKMAAALQAATASGKPVLLRVEFEGGHGGAAATRDQQAELMADAYSFLLWHLGRPPAPAPGRP